MRVAATNPAAGKASGREQGVWRRRLGDALTGLAIWVPLVASAGHVVVFTAWTMSRNAWRPRGADFLVAPEVDVGRWAAPRARPWTGVRRRRWVVRLVARCGADTLSSSIHSEYTTRPTGKCLPGRKFLAYDWIFEGAQMTMLDRMRRHRSWLKWSLGLVCLAFVFFYIPDFLRSGADAASGDTIVSFGESSRVR